MALLFNPLWVMQCSESTPTQVSDPTSTPTRMQTIGTVNWKKGDICRGIICYTPTGNHYVTGWNGTSSKCSAIGFIAFEGNWVKSYSYIHNPARAYNEVNSTTCNTFEFTVDEDYNSVNLGVYCIINNGWVNGHDNQVILVHSIQVDVLRGSEKVFQYHKYSTFNGYAFQGALNWRANNRNYTSIYMTVPDSSNTFNIKIRARDIATATGQWQYLNFIPGIPISGSLYSTTYLAAAGPRICRGLSSYEKWENAVKVGFEIHYTATPVINFGIVMAYTITFDSVRCGVVVRGTFPSIWASSSMYSPDKVIAEPWVARKSYNVVRTYQVDKGMSCYLWISGVFVGVKITPSGTTSDSDYVQISPSASTIVEYL